VHPRAARESAHIVTLLPPEPARAVFERYHLEWRNFGRSGDELPLMGICRHIVLADTDTEAIRIAERAYRVWLKHMELVWNRNGMKLPLGLPPDIEPFAASPFRFCGDGGRIRELPQGPNHSDGCDLLRV
jgi:alkanesulfonate monooxygenase SsuD/methylene tetrahydromethanopterin reductase-like flavin-dependent oxidoreductase (luciferase family)